MSRLTKAHVVVAMLAASLLATASAEAQSRSSRYSRGTKAQQSKTLSSSRVAGTPSPAGNQVVAQLPDLVIARITPDQDGRPPRQITVRNAGGLKAGSYSVRVSVLNGYGQYMYHIDIPNRKPLARGQSDTFSLYTTGDGASWSVRLDPDNRVREGNEKNNWWANNRER